MFSSWNGALPSRMCFLLGVARYHQGCIVVFSSCLSCRRSALFVAFMFNHSSSCMANTHHLVHMPILPREIMKIWKVFFCDFAVNECMKNDVRLGLRYVVEVKCLPRKFTFENAHTRVKLIILISIHFYFRKLLDESILIKC